MINDIIKHSVLNRYLVVKAKTPDKTIALTFDDGPSIENSGSILKTLRTEGVKATFFVVGKEAVLHPELIRSMVIDGHEVASHSYSHSRKLNMKDMKDAADCIKGITGKSPRLFRPPWGKISLRQLFCAMVNNMKTILWSFDSCDYKLKSPIELEEYVMNASISSGDILLFHDDYRHTSEALAGIISNLKTKGFKFKTVTDLLGSSI